MDSPESDQLALIGIGDDDGGNGFIGDDPPLNLLILQALNHQQWCHRLNCLRDKLKIELNGMAGGSIILKAFVTMRALCVGMEALMSLNSFERKYYDMEYRIKIKRGHSRSDSSESIVDLALECVLNKKAALQLLTADAGVSHVSSIKEDRECAGGNEDVKDDAYPPSSGSGLCEPENRGNRKFILRRNVDRSSRSGNVPHHSRLDSSTRYPSLSSLNLSTITDLEASAPILSPMLEENPVVERLRSENLRFNSLLSTSLESDLVSQSLSPHPRKSQTYVPGSSRAALRKENLPLLSSCSQSSIPRSSNDNFLDGDPPKRGTSQFESARDSSILAQSLSERELYSGTDTCAPEMSITRGSFVGLGSRTSTPTDRTPESNTQEGYKSLREGFRDGVFSREDSVITASESSAITVAEYSQSVDEQQDVISTPSNRRTTIRYPYQSPKWEGKLSSSLHHDDVYSNPDRRSGRFSLAPSILNSYEGEKEFGTKDDDPSLRWSAFQENCSAVPTTFSVAAKNTPEPAFNAPLYPSPRHRSPSRTPKIIQIVRRRPGDRVVIPQALDRGHKEQERFGKANLDQDVSDVPVVETSTAEVFSYGNDLKAKDTIQHSTKEYLGTVQRGLDVVEKNSVLNISGTEEITEIDMRAFPKPESRGSSISQKSAIFRPLISEKQKVADARGISSSSLGRSHQKAPDNGSSMLSTGGSMLQNSFGKTAKDYTRPPAKNENVNPRRNNPVTLSPIFSKSSTHLGRLTGRKNGDQALLNRRNSRSVDSLRGQRIFQEATSGYKSSTTTPAASKTGGKVSFTSPLVSHNLETSVKSIPEEASSFKSGKSFGGVLGDITGVGSGSNPRITPRRRIKALGSWILSGGQREKSPLPQPKGHFSQEEVDDLIERLSSHIPADTANLDKSPSKAEKGRNPIAICMNLINTASNESESSRREDFLQMSRVMVDAIGQSRDAECAAEEARVAARRAEVAFLETKKSLTEMAALMKQRKGGF